MANRSSVRLSILLAVIAVGLVLLARTFLDSKASAGSSPVTDTALAADPASGASSTDGAAAPALPAPAARPTVAAETRSAPAAQPHDRSAAETPEELELADAFWVTGTLRFPERTPLGETVVVIADGKKFKHRELHRAQVGSDGSFRVAFSKETKTGHLTIDAPHLFLREPLTLKPSEAASGHVLEPEVGGRVLGVVVPPPGAADVAKELEHTSVTLYAWSPGGRINTLTRNSKIDAERRFELRGIPPGMHCSIACETKSWGDPQIDQVGVEPGIDTPLELVLSRGARVSGRVVDEAGQPVTGCTLAVETEAAGGRGSTSHSGMMNDAKTGAFEFPGLSPGKLTLSASKKGYVDAKLEVGELADGDVREGLELVLAGGGFVAGRVVWPDGRPAEKATVVAEPTAPADEDHWRPSRDARFTTAADGSFRISGLDERPVMVSASAAPRAEAAKDGEKPRAEAGSEKPRAETANDGEKTAAEKPAKSASARRARWAAKVENVAAGSEGLVLTLQPGFVINGSVVDDTGAPIKRFQVVAAPEGDAHGPRFPFAVTAHGRFTADDGRFALEGVHAGMWSVVVNAKGYVSGEGQTIVVPDSLDIGVLTLPRVAVLRGVVVGPEGKPLADAVVEIREAKGERMRHGFSGDDITHTDSKGRFEFKAAPPGDYALVATRDGLAPSEPLAVSVAAGQTLEGLNLTLHGGGRLIVELHPGGNAKIGGRSITLYPRFEGGEWREATTDVSGRATVEALAPGSWQVTADPPEEEVKALGVSTESDDYWELRSSLQKSASVTIVEGETALVVLGTPPAAPVEIRGVVRCGGSPAAGARVQAHFTSEDSESQQRYARCDSTGAYRLTVDQPGNYSFAASREGVQASQWKQVAVPNAATFQVDLEIATGSIAGRVVGPDGAPLSDAWVQLSLERQAAEMRSDSVDAWNSTDEAGTFRFEGLPAAVYTITVSMEQSGADENAPPYSRETVRVPLPENGTIGGVEIRLSIGGILKGTVRDAAGQPANEAFVVLRDASGVAHDDLSTMTDESGHYECRGVSPGAWTARAMREGEISNELAMRMVARSTTELDLDLRPGTQLTVSVFERDGTPVGAAISVRDAQGRQCTAWRPDDNQSVVQRVGPLSPGQYTVTATNHDGGQASATITVTGEATQAVRLTFGG